MALHEAPRDSQAERERERERARARNVPAEQQRAHRHQPCARAAPHRAAQLDEAPRRRADR